MVNSHRSFIRSESFTVGGADWAIRFYPDGYGKSYKDYISVYLELLSEIEVMASCDLRLVNQRTGLASSVHKTETRNFWYHDSSAFAPDFSSFKKRSKIENSDYLRDDRLTIECLVTVIKPPVVTATKSFPRIDMPPSDMTEQVGRLLEDKEGFDVS
jgi:speckle-type POZ protein